MKELGGTHHQRSNEQNKVRRQQYRSLVPLLRNQHRNRTYEDLAKKYEQEEQANSSGREAQFLSELERKSRVEIVKSAYANVTAKNAQRDSSHFQKRTGSEGGALTTSLHASILLEYEEEENREESEECEDHEDTEVAHQMAQSSRNHSPKAKASAVSSGPC